MKPAAADTSWIRLLDYIVFIVLIVAIAGHRSVGYGFAFGWLGGAVIFFNALAGVILASLILRLFFRKSEWAAGAVFTYLALATALATGFAYAGFHYCDEKFKVNDSISQAKIVYFCASHFNHAECVYNVRACPECAKHIVRYERVKMAENLEASDLAIRKRIEQIENKRHPAGAGEHK